MASVQFNGHYTVIYPDHLDASTGKTLVAVPGQAYTVTVAPGRNAGLPSLPGDGRWGASGLAAKRPRGEKAAPPPVTPELPPLPKGAGKNTVPAPLEAATAPESED